MAIPDILSVFWGDRIVGWIHPHRQGRLRFNYAPDWIDRQAPPVSLSLPCQDETFGTEQSTSFFANLLPEERIYKDLCREARLDEKDIYGFLRRFGRECAGALSIVSGSALSMKEHSYRDITDQLEGIIARETHTNLFIETPKIHAR